MAVLAKKIASLLAISAVFLIAGVAGAQERDVDALPKVLVLHSYPTNTKWSALINQSIADELQETIGPTRIYIEHLIGSTTAGGPSGHLVEALSIKYSAVSLDLLIAADPPAIAFALSQRHGLFSDVPIVVMGMPSVFYQARKDQFDGIAGVLEKPTIEETLRGFLAMRPATRRLYVFLAADDTGNATLAHIKQDIAPRFSRIDFRYRQGLSHRLLMGEVRQIPADSLILLLGPTRTESGQFYDLSLLSRLMQAATPAPILGLWRPMVENGGAVGGKVISGTAESRIVARLASDILKGRSPSDARMVRSLPTIWVFNAKFLARYRIDETTLPKGSIVINQQPSFFRQNRKLVIGGSLIFLLQSLLIVILGVENSKRRAASRALTDNQRMLNLILENIPYGVVTIDSKGVVRSFNHFAEYIFGYRADEVIDRNVRILMTDYDASRHSGYINDFIDGGPAKIIGIGRRLTGRRKDGRQFPLRLQINEIKTAEGHFFVGTMDDLTALIGQSANDESDAANDESGTENDESDKDAAADQSAPTHHVAGGPAAGQTPQKPVAIDSGLGPSILIVEDDPGVRALTVTILARRNYRIIEAENGDQAIAHLTSAMPIDLLLSDIMLPGALSGRQICIQAKTLRPDIKIVLMSGFSEISSDPENPTGRDETFLRKPFRAEDLLKAVRKSLAGPEDT